MPTNEELLGLFSEENLKFNISERKGRIDKHEKEINVLRSPDIPSNSISQERINYLFELIEDDEEAISNWQKLLDALPVE